MILSKKKKLKKKIRTNKLLIILSILINSCDFDTKLDTNTNFKEVSVSRFDINFSDKKVLNLKEINFSGDIQGRIQCSSNKLSFTNKNGEVFCYKTNPFLSIFSEKTYYHLQNSPNSVPSLSYKYAKIRTGRCGSGDSYTIHFQRTKGFVSLDTLNQRILKINSHVEKKSKTRIFKNNIKNQIEKKALLEKAILESYACFLKSYNLNPKMSIACKYTLLDSTKSESKAYKLYNYHRDVLHPVHYFYLPNPLSLGLTYLNIEILQELAEFYLNDNNFISYLGLMLPVGSKLNNGNFHKMSFGLSDLLTDFKIRVEINIKKVFVSSRNIYEKYPTLIEVIERNEQEEVVKKYDVKILYTLAKYQ